jgi:hypothetical protein
VFTGLKSCYLNQYCIKKIYFKYTSPTLPTFPEKRKKRNEIKKKKNENIFEEFLTKNMVQNIW